MTAMEMSGENQVIASFTRGRPDTWVMCAEDSIITLRHRNRVRAGYRNHPGTMNEANCGLVDGATMNPDAGALINPAIGSEC